MTTLLQLNPPLEVETPMGSGRAHIRVWNEAGEHYWTVALNDGGAFITLRNHLVRVSENYTAGITSKKPKQRTWQDRKMARRVKR